MGLEELKNSVLEYLIWSELNKQTVFRLRDLEDSYIENLINKNRKKLKEFGLVSSEKTIHDVILSEISNYRIEDWQFQEGIEAGIIFKTFIIHVNKQENAEKLAKLLLSMIEEFKRWKSEDPEYNKTIKLHMYINKKEKEAYKKAFDPEKGTINDLEI